jgi:DNA-binding GntR family transcriptional regulator
MVELERCPPGGTARIEADREFHRLLMQPLDNQLISQLTGAFWDVHAIVAPYLGMSSPEEEAETIVAHRAMVQAARASDVTAFAAAVSQHYAPVRRRIAAAERPDRA